MRLEEPPQPAAENGLQNQSAAEEHDNEHYSHDSLSDSANDENSETEIVRLAVQISPIDTIPPPLSPPSHVLSAAPDQLSAYSSEASSGYSSDASYTPPPSPTRSTDEHECTEQVDVSTAEETKPNDVDHDALKIIVRQTIEAELSEGLEAAKAHMKLRLRLQTAASNNIISTRLAATLKDIRELSHSESFEGFDEVALSTIRRTLAVWIGEFFAITSEQYSELLDMAMKGMLEKFFNGLESTYDSDL
ncbi:hypothetical protein EC991_002949 [Linnemannia zychae]|nr:hypothetical protein EC991_002949 [Linnemannia zychae]